MAQVLVVPFASSLVTIEPFDAAAYPAFIAVLERLWSRETGACGAVVTNHAASGIEVLVMRWSKRIEGDERPKSLVFEGFSNPPYEPVLSAGGRRLATDGGLLPENLPERFAMVGNVPTSVYRRVEIDSAVFEDGTIVGPDRFSVVKYVRGYRSSVEELLRLVDDGLSSGRAIDDIVSDFEVAPDETQMRWRRKLATNVRRNSSFLDYLRRQRNLPANFPR